MVVYRIGVPISHTSSYRRQRDCIPPYGLQRVTDSDKLLRNTTSGLIDESVANSGVQILVIDTHLVVQSVAGDRKLVFDLDSIVGQHLSESLPEWIEITEHIELVQQAGIAFEESFQAHDGRWFRVRLTPIAAGDSFTGLVVVLTDITDQQLSKEALKKSENRYALALQGMCDGVWEWDMVDNFVFYSPTILNLLGYEGNQPIPNTIDFLDDRIHADDHRMMWDNLQSHFSNRTPFECELRLRGSDNDFRWYRMRGQAEWNELNRPTRFASALQDISELRRASQSLALAKLSIERQSEAIFWIRSDGSFYYVNRASCELLGYRQDELMTMGVEQLDAATDALPWAEKANEIAKLAADQRGVRLERKLRRKDGTEIDAEVYASHLNVNGESFFSATVRDMTSAKEREEKARTELQRHSHFLSVLSHELRNPMAAIVNAARLHGKTNTKPEVLEYASMVIQRQSKQMASLLDDLLDVSRITQGRLDLKMEEVDLTLLMEDVLETIEPARVEKKVTVKANRPPTPVTVLGDPVRLRQIQTNLLANAIKHTTENDTITVSVFQDGDQATISVRDTGVGIAPEFIDRMFEMFVQGESPQSRSDGMGIGLTLVRALAELHQGRIEANSEGVGKGAEFRVSIPLSKTTHEPPETTVGGQAGTTVIKKKTLVIVEDNADARNTLQFLLSDIANVSSAQDGESGVRLILENQPDIAVVDIDLPKLSGIEVAKAVRSDPRGQSVTLIALTGHGQRYEKEATKEAGFNDHFIKPLDLPLLERYLN